jgi:hypothetical protein
MPSLSILWRPVKVGTAVKCLDRGRRAAALANVEDGKFIGMRAGVVRNAKGAYSHDWAMMLERPME